MVFIKYIFMHKFMDDIGDILHWFFSLAALVCKSCYCSFLKNNFLASTFHSKFKIMSVRRRKTYFMPGGVDLNVCTM